MDLLITRATALGLGGRPVEAIAGLTGVIAVADREGLLVPCVRATTNLITTLEAVHPRASEEWFPRFFDFVRRAGIREWATRGHILRALFRLWDGDVGGVTDIEQDADLQLVHDFNDQQLAWLAAMRDVRIDGPGWDARLDAVLARLESGGDVQVRMAVAQTRATAVLVRRDWETAVGALISPDTVAPQGLATALYALVRLGDASRLEDVEGVIAGLIRGPARDCVTALAAAVRAGLEGDRHTCIERFAALLPQEEAVDLRKNVAASTTRKHVAPLKRCSSGSRRAASGASTTRSAMCLPSANWHRRLRPAERPGTSHRAVSVSTISTGAERRVAEHAPSLPAMITMICPRVTSESGCTRDDTTALPGFGSLTSG